MRDLLAQFSAIVEQSAATSTSSVELLVDQLGHEGELVRRCAITHQFTPAVLRVLDPSLDPAEAEERYRRLARLSLVMRSPDGMALHDRAREQLFRDWLAADRLPQLREISRRLATYLGELVDDAVGAEREKLSRRHLFHLIAIDQDAGIEAFEEEFERSRERIRYAACDNVLRMVHEYDPILTPANRAHVAYREAKLALDRGAAERALELFESVTNEPVVAPKVKARALYGIGRAHAESCRWKKAALAFLDALQFAEQHESTRPYRCGFLQSLAAVYRDTGNLEAAEMLLTESAKMCGPIAHKRVAASVHNTLGTLYLRGGRLTDAIASLKESLNHLPEDDFARARVYNNLGLATMRVPDFPASEEWFNKSLEQKTLAGDTLGQANTQINLVRLYREQKAPDKAIGAAATAAELFSRVFFWKQAGDAYAMLARFYVEAEKPADGARTMVSAFKAYARAHADEELELFYREMRRAGDDRKHFRFAAVDVNDALADATPRVVEITNDVMKCGTRRFASSKKPILAALLSLLFIGLGQFYNGDWKKAIVMILTLPIGLFFSIFAGIIGIIMIAPAVWIMIATWSITDAWRVAGGKARRW
jgi:tetratricopeptide (TPR) repeat protein